MTHPRPALPLAVLLLLLPPGARAEAPDGVTPKPAAPAEEITEENWTEQAGFAPDLSTVKIKPGKKVKAKNLDQYKALIPEALQTWIREHGLVLKLREYERAVPSEGYLEATNKYRGQAKLVDNGDSYDKPGLTGYVAGLPFPDPQTGLEVAWNFRYAPGADDAEVTYSVYWISGRSGLEHSEEWRLSMLRAVGRTELDPKPVLPALADKGLQGAGLTYALAPYDKKGFGAVYYASVEPKNGQGHIYVPAMRRVLHNTFGTRGDSWNSTDLFYEDVRGYSGYPEWMNWKIVAKKTVLLPIRSGVQLGKKGAKKAFDMDKEPHWNPRWEYEPRPTYVLEVTPKLPDYPYSKQLLYVDAEVYQILYKEAYDRKGDLWKVLLNAGAEHPDEETGETYTAWGGTVVVDVQAKHATLFHVHKARGNVGLDPKKFSLSELRKRGR